MKSLLTGAALLALATTTAGAQPYDPKDPRVTLYSEAILRKALADIAHMQEPELRALVHYLAECSADGADDATRHFCVSAQKAYEIEFGAKRALDSMIYARSGWDSAHLDPDRFSTAEIVDDLIKYGKAVAALESAARERFRTLNREEHHAIRHLRRHVCAQRHRGRGASNR